MSQNMKIRYSYNPDTDRCYVLDNAKRTSKLVVDGLSPRDTVKALWIMMCEHENIDPRAKFVIFEDSNPYKAAYDAAVTQMFKNANY